MSIRERRPGVWQIRAYAGVDEAGRSKYVYRTFLGSKSEAKKEEIRLKANAGALPRGTLAQTITLDDYFERYMGLYVEPGAAPKTIAGYRNSYKGIIAPRLGKTKLSALNHEICQKAINEALESYAHSSVSVAKSILSACLNRARASGLIMSNPVSDIRMPRHQQAHIRALTPLELNTFVNAALSAENGIYGPFVAAAALTGMRRGELSKLRWSNVDFTLGVIRVREGGSRPNTTKSSTGQRDVAIPNVLKEVLLSRYEEDIKRRSSSPSWNPRRLVFTNRSGGEIYSATDMSKLIQKVMKKAGIDLPGFRLHDLRHSHGSILVNAGASITDVAARLGQVVQTTVRTYLHSSATADRGLTDVLDSMTGGQVH